MALNESYDFGKEADEKVRKSFRDPPKRQLFAKDTMLYRVYSIARQRDEPGRYWFSEKVYSQLRTFAQRVGVSIADCVRSRLAVAIDWTPSLDCLCSGRLNQAAYGFEGLAAYQQLVSKDANPAKGLSATPEILLMGNYSQIWFPALGKDEIEVTPMAGLRGKIRA